MKKIICLLTVLALCFSAVPAWAESSSLEQANALIEAGDYDTAIPLLQEAAEQGDADAQNELGKCYAQGIGVEKDDEEAVRYFRMAADQGFAKSQFNLANSYLYGVGVEQDTEKAAEYLGLAADQGLVQAQGLLGYMYENGFGVEADPEKAVEYYQAAADQGDANAQNNLGNCYFYGRGVEQDIEKGVQYYQFAAEQGDPAALNSLGCCYGDGNGVEQNFEKALECYRLAAEQGNPDAIYNIGYSYYFGEGVEEDDDKALEYFREAAELGQPNAMFLIGESYYEGKGAEQDLEKAAEWYQQALEAGYEPDEADQAHLKELFGEDDPTAKAEPETETHQIEKKTYPFYEASTDKTWKDDFPLYFVDGVEDLPYVALSDWRDFLLFINGEDEEDSGYQLSYTVDEAKNTVTLDRGSGYTMEVDYNEGEMRFVDFVAFNQIPNRGFMDITGFPEKDKDGQPFLLNRTKSRNLYGDYTVIKLNDYKIPMIAQDGIYLLPLQTLAAFTVSQRDISVYFNGECLIMNAIQAMVDPWTDFVTALALSGLVTPELLQKYQAFEGTSEERREYLLKEVENASEQGAALVGNYRNSLETSVYMKYISAPKAMRSEELIAYGYRELCLELDCFYGLKDAHNISSFNLFFQQTGLIIGLADPDAAKADNAIAELMRYWLDDGHSDYLSNSYLSDSAPDAAYGFNVEGRSQLGNVLAAYRAKYPESVLPYYEDGDTAYITFDSFSTLKGDVGGFADYYALSENDELSSDTLSIVILAHREITRENSPIRNVVLDLSGNGGGEAPAAAYLLGWFLGEADVSFRDTFTGSQTTSYVQADVNLDHQFDENDTLAGRGLHLYCLISPKSFSCGNLVPWAFKANGSVTLLGKTSGGGSCVVGYNTTAWGSSYRYSSSTRISFVKNGAYYDVDTGAAPDHVIDDYDHFYDRSALTEFIHGLY